MGGRDRMIDTNDKIIVELAERVDELERAGIYRIVVADSKVTQTMWVDQAELDEIARQISKFRSE